MNRPAFFTGRATTATNRGRLARPPYSRAVRARNGLRWGDRRERGSQRSRSREGEAAGPV